MLYEDVQQFGAPGWKNIRLYPQNMRLVKVITTKQDSFLLSSGPGVAGISFGYLNVIYTFLIKRQTTAYLNQERIYVYYI